MARTEHEQKRSKGQRTQRNTPQGTKEPLIDQKPQTPIENGARTTGRKRNNRNRKATPDTAEPPRTRAQAPRRTETPLLESLSFSVFP